MNELKPCPFCRGAPIVVANKYRHDQTTYCVRCSNNDCAVIPVTYEATDLQYAVEAWNRRYNDA